MLSAVSAAEAAVIEAASVPGVPSAPLTMALESAVAAPSTVTVPVLSSVLSAVSAAEPALITPSALLVIVLASAVVVSGHLATFLIAAHTAGSIAPLTRLVPLTLLALLAMGLPANVGGFGPREGVAAWAFGAAGLTATQGVATAVVYGALVLAASLPGAAVLLVRRVRVPAPVAPEGAVGG